MAVSKRLRYEILRRDNHACRYCGLAAPDVKLTVDHVVPTALGGSDDPSNLVAACVDCNAGKSASSPDAAIVADVDQKAVRWSQAMQVAIESRAAELAQDRANTSWFDEAWNSWKQSGGDTMPRDANWKNSILRFLAGGLDREFLRDAIYTSMGNDRLPNQDRWRYFCGICWRELDALRERAATHLEEPKPATAGLPYGPGYHPQFDALSLAESFIADLVEHAGLPRQALQLATRAYWDGMQEAYAAFLAALPDPTADADLQASEQLSNVTAFYMAQIQQTCQGQVLDGAE